MTAPTPPGQPFEPQDIFLERRITELHLVQGQPIAAATVRSIDAAADGQGSSIWLLAMDGSDVRRLTRSVKSTGTDKQPRWSADGRRIAFLSDRAGGALQLYLIAVDGGEASALGHRERGWVSHAWRPDGRQLLALGSVTVEPDRQHAGAADADPQAPARDSNQPQVAWRLPYKMDGTGYLLDSRVQLFLVDASDGTARQLTCGDGEVSSAAWSHDGNAIVFCRMRDEQGQQHCSDVWLLPMHGDEPGEPRRLSHEQSTASSPSASPDGRWIAFTGAIDEGDAQRRLWLVDRRSGAVRALGDESLEVVAGELQWHRHSDRLAFIRAHRGLQQVATIEVPGGRLQGLDGGARHVSHLCAGARMAYTAESPSRPLELFSAEWDGSDERQLSQFNRWWQARSAPRTALRRFQVPDGEGGQETIDGWLLLPAQHEGPMPLLVDVHGGPASYVPLRFPVHAYWQVLCSRGWAVLALNTVGSASYGREFAGRLLARWGRLDLPQHEAAVQQLREEGLADERVAIAGSSYGGYLSAWAIGTSRRFRAAVVCAPVANLESHYGSSDSGYYADPYSMQRKPEADRELMAELSPMLHIEQALTPTLFLQGKDDQRCPVGQSEELFVKLMRTGRVPTQLVLYPGGSHHVFGEGRPSHRLDGVQRIVSWLERWIDRPLPAPERC